MWTWSKTPALEGCAGGGTSVIQTGFELLGFGRARPTGALYLVDDVGVS